MYLFFMFTPGNAYYTPTNPGQVYVPQPPTATLPVSAFTFISWLCFVKVVVVVSCPRLCTSHFDGIE